MYIYLLITKIQMQHTELLTTTYIEKDSYV